MARYALKIRKSDLELLALLNGGLEPALRGGKASYLIVDTDPEGNNQILTERGLAEQYDVNAQGPTLLKLKATR